MIDLHPGFEVLRSKYPWPAEYPAGNRTMYGWCQQEVRGMIRRYLDACDAKCIVELGTFYGLSARVILDHRPDACLLTIDDFKSLVSIKDRNQGKTPMNRSLRDQAYKNLWKNRDRALVIITTTLRGMADIYAAGLEADFVYVDASHDYESVIADVELAINLWPQAQIVGHDWNYETTVQAAVKRIAHVRGFGIDHNKLSWAFVKE